MGGLIAEGSRKDLLLILIQLYDFFEKHNLFYNSQYGFRKSHSTELAGLELIENVISSMDNNIVPVGIFIDLSKAFDTLNHDILLHKLSFYGVSGISLKLFESYLSNRKQYVNFDNVDLDFKKY